MPKAPKTLHHPTFGECELLASIIAIRWSSPRSREDIVSALAPHNLQLALDPVIEKRKAAPKGVRDAGAPTVNQSSLLSWAVSEGALTEAQWNRIAEEDRVEWVAPVYAAKRAEEGPRSYFAVNPTLLVLSGEASSRIGDIASLDPAATIDQQRTNLLKGSLVVRFADGNVIDVASRLLESGAVSGVTNALSFENIPYLMPVAACGCGSDAHAGGGGKACQPATQPHVPNDPYYPIQWGLQRINASSAWPITRGDPNVVVAVLDQGVELAHPDLNLWPISYSTITHTNDGSPVGNHGTACAGIIASKMDDALGAAGLASDCPVMAIATNFADTEVAEGLYYAADNGARVVSMSFGVYPSWMVWNFALIEAALQYCVDKGVVLVAAAGNENAAVARFPGSDSRTICVGGSNRDDVRKSIGDTSIESWWGACYGPSLDVVAPCLEIPTTDRLGAAGYTPIDYDLRFNGTSSATPHVAALAGLILSANPALSALDVRRIISETTDKINPAGYAYLPTPGKPYGTWTAEVGYGRINAERAVLVACTERARRTGTGPCAVQLPEPDPCCVSPCDPPWRPDAQCLHWYEDKYFRTPLRPQREGKAGVIAAAEPGLTDYIEFRITYEHQICLLGKQHGPLLYTTTLLPGETIRLYHSDRYRRITTTQQRFSVQTTFLQFLSIVHQARVSGSLDLLSQQLSSAKSSSAEASGGGFFAGLFGWGGGGESSRTASVSSLAQLSIHAAAETFDQSIRQASLLTHAERSLVVSTYEEKDTQDVTVRTLHNANDCRAVTYFVRQVVELYAVSTRVSGISYRIIAPNVPPEWHDADDLDWLPAPVRDQIRAILRLLPKVGQVVSRPKPISLPTDGAVYDPELAHCGACEPERAAALALRLEREKAETWKACLEAKVVELEIERRCLLLRRGELGTLAPAPAAAPALTG